MSTAAAQLADLSAAKRNFLDAPDEAVFLERARILGEARRRYAALPEALRQASAVADLCGGLTVIVNSTDVFPARLLEEVPEGEDEAFVRDNPELFVQPGVPGFLDSTHIYCPDWAKLLEKGLAGLASEAAGKEREARRAGESERAEELGAVRISLEAVSTLARRFAAEARREAARLSGGQARRLEEAAESCERIAGQPPQSLREALQLYLLFHTVLSCVIGARNVTPGRMDQWLLPFYRRDVAEGRLGRAEAVELLAVAMVVLSQGSGTILTDFQSVKRTPNRHSHYYITLAGGDGRGGCAANELSLAILEAVRLTGLREPTVEVRWTPDIDTAFRREALAMMRDGLPVMVYNERLVVKGLERSGVPPEAAEGFVHAGCMNGILPGFATACMRDNFNMAAAVARTVRKASAAACFDDFCGALRSEVRTEISARRPSLEKVLPRLPLPVWPLFEGHLAAGRAFAERTTRYLDLHLVGVATAVDSLLAVKRFVYERKMLTLAEFARALSVDFAGYDQLRAELLRERPFYGEDEPEVLGTASLLGAIWTEEVERSNSTESTLRLRPGFHSWLFNLEMGRETPATPDGRRAGRPLSSDLLPVEGRGRVPTAILKCMAALPLERTPSGGTTLALDGAHFEGEAGLERLRALVDGYFRMGGLQLHFVFADRALLLDAVEHPENHRGLLVRVTGYSEYFTRLLPEVQRDIIRRTPPAKA